MALPRTLRRLRTPLAKVRDAHMGGHTVPLAGIVPSAFRDRSATARALIVAGFVVLAVLMLAAVSVPPSATPGTWSAPSSPSQR